MFRSRIFPSSIIALCFLFEGYSQPKVVEDGVEFSFTGNTERSVSLAGDFNAWSKYEDPMQKDQFGVWRVVKKISPGIFQYLFLIVGERYEKDPLSPVAIDNFNKSGKNSIFVLTKEGKILLTAVPPVTRWNPNDEYEASPDMKPVYLNIIWHQHQPLYVNPETDQLQGPWVRTHATKDYYDMAAMLRAYPHVHCNINLTSSLLHQLREYYVNRLQPFVDVKKNRVNTKAFWAEWKGKTDPWIDLALKPTSDFNEVDKNYLYRNTWNAFGISEVMIERFPEYYQLKQRLDADQVQRSDLFTEQEMREIKFWFYLAHFDPDFLLGPVELPDGSVCDLSEYVELKQDKKFYLKKKIVERDCQRMVAEAYKVMANIIPVHKSVSYSTENKTGQVEIITTPYFHPILPLIYDSDLAKICQPSDLLPPRFSYPQDAKAQVVKAVRMYREVFGSDPTGMWPGEGAVAQPILSVLRDNGILWTASDARVLNLSRPGNRPNTTPYRFPAGRDEVGIERRHIAMVFRNTELSDRIGFRYQNYEGEEAAEDFVRAILSFAPKTDEDDVLVTVILDGENAWEWYRHDIDGKDFLNSLYRKLTKLFETNQIITTTTVEYLMGNPERGIAAHSFDSLPAMEWLYPGSWINGTYDTWIGEPEENTGWEYLLRARQDLERSGINQPDPAAGPPQKGTQAWNAYMAWEAMYSAEGSDWFWWYGYDQSAPAGDKPFDTAFRLHLENVYKFANLAGASMASPGFEAIIRTEKGAGERRGAMARGHTAAQLVTFACDASDETVPAAIYIVGNTEELGDWVPNAIRMYDDGTNGDAEAGDSIWSLQLEMPVGEKVEYKYTNSGRRGEWIKEEFPIRNRFLIIQTKLSKSIVIRDVFGK